MFDRKLVIIFFILCASYLYVGINKDKYIAEENDKKNKEWDVKKNDLSINYSLIDSDGYFFDITKVQHHKVIFSSSIDSCSDRCINVMKKIYQNMKNKKISFIFFTNDVKKDYVERLAEFKENNEIHFNVVTGNYNNVLNLLKAFNKTLQWPSCCDVFDDNIDMIYILDDDNLCVRSTSIFDDKFYIEDFFR